MIIAALEYHWDGFMWYSSDGDVWGLEGLTSIDGMKPLCSPMMSPFLKPAVSHTPHFTEHGKKTGDEGMKSGKPTVAVEYSRICTDMVGYATTPYQFPTHWKDVMPLKTQPGR